jgi:hypothetical protein
MCGSLGSAPHKKHAPAQPKEGKWKGFALSSAESRGGAVGAKAEAAFCERLANRLVDHCAVSVAPLPTSPPHDAPNFDSLASSIAFGSVVIMVVTLVVVFAGIVVAIQWARGVVAEAKSEAAKAAKETIGEVLRGWLNDEAPTLVRTHVELILARSPATTAADEATDEMGRSA